MKLKKVMAVSLAAAMALSMTACGGGSSGEGRDKGRRSG